MKKILKTSIILLIVSLSSCAKNGCRTCTDNPNAPGVRAEICPDRITTYHNNQVLTDLENPNSVLIGVLSLEAAGYKCN